MRKEYERNVPRASGGSYGTSTDIFNLPVGTRFNVFNGGWDGEIIEKDSKKYLRSFSDNSDSIQTEFELKEDVFYDLVLYSTFTKKTEETKVGCYYKHYKGGLYIVLEIAIHTESGEELIIYKDMEGNIWARPRGMFEDSLEYEGNYVKRFTEVKSNKRRSQL